MEPKILRLLDPQGEPDIIECDGKRYVPERTCSIVVHPVTAEGKCSACGGVDTYMASPLYCSRCGAKVVYE